MAKKKVSKKRNRRAQDATLINVDALKSRLDIQAIRLKQIELEIAEFYRVYYINLESHNLRLFKLEAKDQR